MLTLNLSELILTVINFFVLLFLLKRFLYGPLIAFMDQRNARIQAALEQERTAAAALNEEVVRCEQRRKESRETARRIVHDAQAADERRHSERVMEAYAETMSQCKEEKLQETRQNEEEARLMEGENQRLAAVLAKTLLGHFPDPPEMMVAQGLQVARERAEITWEADEENAVGEEPEKRERKKTADLFASDFDLREPVDKEREPEDTETVRNIRYEQLFLRTDLLECL